MAFIIEEGKKSGEGFGLRGAAAELWKYKGQEAMLAGPAETGKSIACLLKCHALLLKYPGTQGALVRQTYASMGPSVILSYEKKILGPLFKTSIMPYGGEKPEWYDYPNGSRLWIGGLDNPTKVLSSERDFVCINQAEEITLEAWMYILTRTTGRAGNMPYAQVFGDCNPGPPTHWIINRPSLQVFYSKHEDNPTLYDDDGNIKEQGKRSIAALDSLSGTTYQRLRLGKWIGAEGVIYDEFDMNIHVITRDKLPQITRYYEFVDFGYTHPFVWHLIGLDDHNNIYIIEEVYWSERIVEDHVKLINTIMIPYPEVEDIICDHDAEDRRTYEKHRKGNKKTKKAKKSVKLGIDAVKERLNNSKFHVRGIYYVKDALRGRVDPKLVEKFMPTSTLAEFTLYVWNEEKDAPVKENDHGMDLLRYEVVHIDKPKARKQRSHSQSHG